MELQTVIQVSKTFGISAQMLRYYERNGLIQSSRKDDYAYRVYDEDAIKRLQQIVILRKLQIPVKQIEEILGNPNAVKVVEIFKQNIEQLDIQITALSTFKSILVRFVDELQTRANVYLKSDLLSNNSMLALVDSLSFPDNKIKEKITMEDLNKASANFDSIKERAVRVVNYPTEKMARLRCKSKFPDEDEKKTMEKFIRDNDLIKIKPDFKVIGYDKQILVTIPQSFEIPEPFDEVTFHGGLYATFTHTPQNKNDWELFDIWFTNNEEYMNDQGAANEHSIARPSYVIYFNPLNILGLKNTDIFNSVMNVDYYDEICPIKEKERVTDDKIATLEKWEETASSKEPFKVDLKAMEKGDLELSYINDMIVIKSDVDYPKGMTTLQKFRCPMKIYMRAKTDKNDLCIFTPVGNLNIHAGDFGKPMVYFAHDKIYPWNTEGIPIGEFIDIEWILGTDIMAIKINGELKIIGEDFGYISKLRENPDSLTGYLTLTTCRGSTVTIESLRVTEL